MRETGRTDPAEVRGPCQTITAAAVPINTTAVRIREGVPIAGEPAALQIAAHIEEHHRGVRYIPGRQVRPGIRATGQDALQCREARATGPDGRHHPEIRVTDRAEVVLPEVRVVSEAQVVEVREVPEVSEVPAAEAREVQAVSEVQVEVVVPAHQEWAVPREGETSSKQT